MPHQLPITTDPDRRRCAMNAVRIGRGVQELPSAAVARDAVPVHARQGIRLGGSPAEPAGGLSLRRGELAQHGVACWWLRARAAGRWPSALGWLGGLAGHASHQQVPCLSLGRRRHPGVRGLGRLHRVPLCAAVGLGRHRKRQLRRPEVRAQVGPQALQLGHKGMHPGRAIHQARIAGGCPVESADVLELPGSDARRSAAVVLQRVPQPQRAAP
jgi:hypothetical protein